MASEIQASFAITFAKDGASDGMVFGGVFDLTSSRYQRGKQNVGTVEEALILGDAAVGGWIAVKNLGPTNYVEIKGATGATPLIRLKVNEGCLFRRSATSTAPFVQANTGAVDIEYLLLSD